MDFLTIKFNSLIDSIQIGTEDKINTSSFHFCSSRQDAKMII